MDKEIRKDGEGEVLFDIRHLTHTFETEDGKTFDALKDVTAQIMKGSFTAIIGTNGSGKSTLARHLNALMMPTSGEVIVEGMSTSDYSHIWDIRQKVGMVFQNPDNQLVAAIVEEDVAFGPENLGVPPDEIRRRVDAALEKVGMTEFRTHAPAMLSGGQKQRIAIAGILAMHPDCIVRFGITQVLFEETGHGFSSSLELGHGARLVEPAGEACVFLIIFRAVGRDFLSPLIVRIEVFGILLLFLPV